VMLEVCWGGDSRDGGGWRWLTLAKRSSTACVQCSSESAGYSTTDRAQQHPGRQTTPPATVKDSSCRTGQDRTSLRRGCSKEWTVDCGREGRTGCLGREQQRERKSGFAERGTSKGSKVKSKAPVPVPVPVQGQRGRLRQRSPAQQASCRPP